MVINFLVKYGKREFLIKACKQLINGKPIDGKISKKEMADLIIEYGNNVENVATDGIKEKLNNASLIQVYILIAF